MMTTNRDPRPRMDVHATIGTRIVFKYPNEGTAVDQERARIKLVLGKTYTVKETWPRQGIHSSVMLYEVPGVWFRTDHFAEERQLQFI